MATRKLSRSWWVDYVFHKHTLALAAALAASAGAGALYAYKRDEIARTKQLFYDWAALVYNGSKSISAASKMAADVTEELQDFLSTNKNDIPPRIRQMLKLLSSTEVQSCVRTTVTTIVEGSANVLGGDPSDGVPVLDKVLESLLSEKGKSLLGLAIGVAARNSTSVFCDFLSSCVRNADIQAADLEVGFRSLAAWATSEQGERLLSLLTHGSVKAAVAVYIDKTSAYNTVNDILSALSKRENAALIKEIVSTMSKSFCQEAMTLVMARQELGFSTTSVAQGLAGFLTEICRRDEVRRLIVDVARTTTREAIQSALHTSPPGSGSGSTMLFVQSMARQVYVLASVLLFLGVYAVSPRTLA